MLLKEFYDDILDGGGGNAGAEPFKVGPVSGSARVPTIVISGPDQGPAGMSLTPDIGRGRLILGVERVELLVEPMFGGDAGIDRTADRLGRRGLHGRPPGAGRSALSRRPKNRGPFHLVPVIAKATLVRLS